MANFLFYRYKFVQGPTDASLFPVDSDEPVSGELHNRRLAEDLLSKATSGTYTFAVHLCSRLFTVVQSVRDLGRMFSICHYLYHRCYKCGTKNGK